jgi:hypothetical protein
MKAHLIIRSVAILFYSSIYLMGMLIGMPFICYLFLTPFFEWETPSQPLTALAAITGLLILLYTYFPRTRSTGLRTEIIIFLLLLTPVAERLLSVPLVMFNYPAFIIPTACFLTLYPLSIFLRQRAEKIQSSLLQKRDTKTIR